MYKYISYFIIISLFLYPITAISTFQNSDVALWQSVLFSILKPTESPPITDIKDMNGDTVIDVRDLCIVIQKMKNEKTKIPISKTLKHLVLYNFPFRMDKILFSLKKYSHQNYVLTNFGQKSEEYAMLYNMQIVKWVKLNICIKIPILPLLC